MGTRRARLTALISGGAIPDTADYQVRLEPEGTLVGTVNEDWAIESNGGDIFQLGNASWRVLRVEPGIVRVADAKGAPPTLPFWLGEAPGRTRELSARDRTAARRVRGPRRGGAAAFLTEQCGGGAARRRERVQIAEYVEAGRQALGDVPTPRRVILERFFDESGGMQLVVHAPFGSRINRAWGLALRKRFCVGFGFELQAAANEEAIVLSLGPQHSFELAEVFDYLHPNSAREVLIAGAPRRAALRDALALERAALAPARAARAAARRCRRRSCGCARPICSSRRSRRCSPAPRRCRAARSRCRWTIRSCARRSRTA